jgi:hypothetical protein
MRVDFVKQQGLKPQQKTSQAEAKEVKNPIKAANTLSYLEIPKLAFSGNIVKTPDQEKQKLEKLGTIPLFVDPNAGRFNLKKAMVPKSKEVQMFVNPQDPLVTKPELMSLTSVKGFAKGPVGDRVKIVDYGRPLAEPNARGNFIYPVNSSEFDQVNAFALVDKTLNIYQDLLGRNINWGFEKNQLQLFPHAGKMMNAYYSRKDGAIKLFEFVRPDTGKVVKTCQSSDVVTHETGHAVLDGIKPKFLENFGFGVAGFHEAFADTTAMLSALQNDSLINTMLEATAGDLRKENIIACLAEEFGDAIHKNDHNPANDNMQYLRNAINFFEQKPYKEMPYRDRVNDDTVLGLESHSYSRLYLGAAYDVLVGMYEKAKPTNSFGDQKFALMQARDEFAQTFARALDFSPAGEVDFKDMALAMMKADLIDNKGKNLDVIEKVFVDRKILQPADVQNLKAEMAALPEMTLPNNLNTPAEVIQFVNDNKDLLGVPKKVKLNPTEAYMNSKGEKHIVCTFDNPAVLSGPQFGRYQGQMVNILGTLALSFDQDGKLIDKTFKNIDKQVEEDVLHAISLMIKNMRVKEADSGNASNDLQTMEMPGLMSRKSEFGDFNELIKEPVIVDPIDHNKIGMKSLGEYFKKLQAQMPLAK